MKICKMGYVMLAIIHLKNERQILIKNAKSSKNIIVRMFIFFLKMLIILINDKYKIIKYETKNRT